MSSGKPALAPDQWGDLLPGSPQPLHEEKGGQQPPQQSGRPEDSHASSSQDRTKPRTKQEALSRSSAKSAVQLQKFLNGEGGGKKVDFAAQRARMARLSSPSRVVRPKVETDGIAKGTIEKLQYEANQIPGPGAYAVQEALSNTQDGVRGGRFSTAAPMSDVDRMVLDASRKPGPGAYRIKGGSELVSGGRFSTGSMMSEVERLVLDAKTKPAPGQYGHINRDATGHKLLGEGGGGFSKSSPPTNVDVVMKRAAQTPGPGAYKVKGAAELMLGGSFSTAAPMSDVDRMVLDASRKPGPGAYRIKGGSELVSGGRFSTSVPLSATDRMVMDAATKPGPGQYGAPDKARRGTGGTGRFFQVYKPKDPELKHLRKG